MLFSQKRGLTSLPILQRNEISVELRNTLWNIVDVYLRGLKDEYIGGNYVPGILIYAKVIYHNYFKEPIDTIPKYEHTIILNIRTRFFDYEWFEVFDFLEKTINYSNNPIFEEKINSVLATELSAYRFVNGNFTDITSEEELKSLKESLQDDDFPGVKIHLKTALQLMSDRDNPNYRNSIKESISAVECLACIITQKDHASLGDALKVIEKHVRIHPALRESFNNLYGYTSNADGIRHALLDEPDLGPEDAKYFLLACSSFINYLKSKL